MRLATILREAGFPTNNFKNCAEIPIVLYDRKDRIISDDDIHFVERLFHNNPSTHDDFSTFLNYLEKNPITSPINVKIDEDAVFIFYKTQNCKIFLSQSRNPMDFMD